MKESWELKDLKSACQIKPPKKEAKQLLKDSDLVSFVPMNDLGIDKKYFSTEASKPLGKVSGSYIYFRDGDVLLAKITPCFENGKLGIAADLENGIGFGSSEFIVYRPNKELSPEFLYYYLNQPSFRETGASQMTGAVGHKRIPKDFYEGCSIPIPPLEEQKQIVAVLDEAFAAIDQAKENIEKNLQNAKELFQSKLNEIFTQKGAGWEERKIEDLTEIVTKGSSPKWQGISYVEHPGILFITSENVGTGTLLMKKRKFLEERFNDIQKKSILIKGDVLTNIVGASIGRTAIYTLDDIANINQAVCIMRCKETELYNYYLMHLLNSPYFNTILHDNEVDNARANLSLTFFKKLQIWLPRIQEQKDIVKGIEELNHNTNLLIKGIERKLASLDELRKSILQKAFAGELA